MRPLQTAVIFSVHLVSIWSTFIKKNKFQIQKWNLIFKVTNKFSRLPLFRPPTQSSVSKARWAKTLWGHYKYTNSICCGLLFDSCMFLHSQRREELKRKLVRRGAFEKTHWGTAPLFIRCPLWTSVTRHKECVAATEVWEICENNGRGRMYLILIVLALV